MQWTLVIPLKPLARAKSRLSDTADDGMRPGLALAFAEDTVAAALACPAVRDVAVVTGRSWPAASWRPWAPASSPTSPGAA
ncbi:Phosphoenolpyruvate guanylyltransferase OS=Streptomyces fumanus OX=67302 GN=cofC PE=3 SV=1 [Streptomyces fumanus]